jgi:hypothetical protein
MTNEQILIGYTTAALCIVGLAQADWLLNHSRHGQRLIRWFGPRRAPFVLRLILLMGTVLGLLLGNDWIQPIRW